LQQAVADYYALLPGNLETGFARLTARFKRDNNQTFATYASFWKTIRSVSVSGLTATGNTVTAEITYVKTNGATSHERHVYTLVQQNGSWAIDTQRPG
jgi:hypothetical protein